MFDGVDPGPGLHRARATRGDRSDWPMTGILAQRAKDRPNRIGSTVCPLVSASGLTIEVVGLDAIDGTPVLDVKPYLTGFAPRGEVREPTLGDRADGRLLVAVTTDRLSRRRAQPRHARAPAPPPTGRAPGRWTRSQHLVGLQAQIPLDPYTALWSRLDGVRPRRGSGGCSIERALVRIVVMRGTIHLVTADDALVLRPLVQPVLDAELARHSRVRAGARRRRPRPGPEVRAGTRFDGEPPRPGPELRAALPEQFPDLNPGALGYACRNHLALVQAPPAWRLGHVRCRSG